jgi:hypothetical protein
MIRGGRDEVHAVVVEGLVDCKEAECHL